MNEFIVSMNTSFTLWGVVTILFTVVLFYFFKQLHKRFLPYSIAHPLILTVTFLALLLAFLPVTLVEYQQASAIIHWSLGPVTVALAVPLYQQWEEIKVRGKPLILGLAVGGILAPLLAWISVWWLHAPLALQMTMLAKSITTPLAMNASQAIGGVPELAAVFVILTGIVGATVSDWVFRWCKITDDRAKGIALGSVAHAVGTAKAVATNNTVGACASIALCINGVLTAILLPLLFQV